MILEVGNSFVRSLNLKVFFPMTLYGLSLARVMSSLREWKTCDHEIWCADVRAEISALRYRFSSLENC